MKISQIASIQYSTLGTSHKYYAKLRSKTRMRLFFIQKFSTIIKYKNQKPCFYTSFYSMVYNNKDILNTLVFCGNNLSLYNILVVIYCSIQFLDFVSVSFVKGLKTQTEFPHFTPLIVQVIESRKFIRKQLLVRQKPHY